MFRLITTTLCTCDTIHSILLYSTLLFYSTLLCYTILLSTSFLYTTPPLFTLICFTSFCSLSLLYSVSLYSHWGGRMSLASRMVPRCCRRNCCRDSCWNSSKYTKGVSKMVITWIAEKEWQCAWKRGWVNAEGKAEKDMRSRVLMVIALWAEKMLCRVMHVDAISSIAIK